MTAVSDALLDVLGAVAVGVALGTLVWIGWCAGRILNRLNELVTELHEVQRQLRHAREGR